MNGAELTISLSISTAGLIERSSFMVTEYGAVGRDDRDERGRFDNFALREHQRFERTECLRGGRVWFGREG